MKCTRNDFMNSVLFVKNNCKDTKKNLICKNDPIKVNFFFGIVGCKWECLGNWMCNFHWYILLWNFSKWKLWCVIWKSVKYKTEIEYKIEFFFSLVLSSELKNVLFVSNFFCTTCNGNIVQKISPIQKKWRFIYTYIRNI